MSKALLKRSLQIVEETLNVNKINTNIKHKKLNKRKVNTSSTFDLIPENQRLIKVSINKKTKEKSKCEIIYDNFQISIFPMVYLYFAAKINEMKQKQKITIKQAKHKLNRGKEKISENLRKILMMDSAVKMSDEATDTLLRRARTQRYVIPEQKPAEESTTAFTEEDFLKFEKEYFVN